MEENKISKEDLFNTIKHGHKWHANKIKEELHKLIIMKSHSFNIEPCNVEGKRFYIYDNECTLFVFDGKIEVNSERENVFSSYKTSTYQIKEATDILIAYEHFNSVIMEDEED
jgi:hypothetical protein